MRKMFTMLTLTLAMLGVSISPQAHEGLKPTHGGQVIETADGWRIEFAVWDGGIHAWVRDHSDKPVTALGKATLLVGGKKIDVPLRVEDGMLTGDAAVTSAGKMTAILSLTVGGKPIAARFSR